jgi:hypothetical protein
LLWPIWQLPPRLLWPILVVELTAVLLVVLLDRPIPGREDLVALAVLGGLGLAHTEFSRDVERVRWRLTGDLHVDLTSVWVFAAAAAIAPGYAAVLAATVHTYLWLCSARTRASLHRQVFSTATIVLSCLAAAAVMRFVRAGLPLLDAAGGMPAALLLGMLVFLTVNSALVAGAIAISTADHADAAASPRALAATARTYQRPGRAVSGPLTCAASARLPRPHPPGHRTPGRPAGRPCRRSRRRP